MKIKCYSVRLASFERISDKAYKAVGYDGSNGFIPASQFYGYDLDVTKSEAIWVSAWFMERSNLTYSTKKVAWFDSNSGKMLPTYTRIVHNAKKINPIESNEIADLKKSK